MANLYAFRSGQQKLVKYPVASATVIEKGDMLYLADSTGLVEPAGDLTWNSALAATQADFADAFVGIANAPSATGETDDIDVDISATSVYEMPCASATYIAGTPMGPDKASGSALLDQQLEEAVAASSVARVVETTSGAVTKVRVTFASIHNVASNNVNSGVG